jgi:hypothetical protein
MVKCRDGVGRITGPGLQTMPEGELEQQEVVVRVLQAAEGEGGAQDGAGAGRDRVDDAGRLVG